MAMVPRRSRYCLCKHGPDCRRHVRDVCGFAHSHADVEDPEAWKYNDRLWVCLAHEGPGAPGGISIFVGQVFGPEAMERYVKYLQHVPLRNQPPTVQMFCWFHGFAQYPVEWFVLCGDFGFGACVARLSSMWKRPVREQDVLACQNWPFEQERVGAETLVERLQRRMASARRLWTYRCQSAFDGDGWDPHRDPESLPYLNLVDGDLYVRLEDIVVDGWVLVVHADFVRDVRGHAGWAPPSYFEQAPVSSCVYHEMPSLLVSRYAPPVERQETVEEDWFSASSASGASGADEPPTSLLPLPCQTPRLMLPLIRQVILVSDGSAMEQCGFAAAFVADQAHLGGRCSLKCRMSGAEAAELCGILLAGLSLCRKPGMFETAVFRCDSLNAVNSVFHGKNPTTPDGTHLYAGILACRRVMELLRHMGINVVGEWVSREHTKEADLVAKAELRRRFVVRPLKLFLPA